MPTSSNKGKKDFIRWISEIEDITLILDVGCGEGTYPKLFKEKNLTTTATRWYGIEAWKDYISEFNLPELYNVILNQDARTLDWAKLPKFDLVIFGDVLEHMTKEESVTLVSKALDHSKFVFISIPVVHSPQGEVNGNPYEAHIKDDWTHEEVLSTFPFITKSHVAKKIGVYLLSKKDIL
jgi:2-polyprenyl-3-methyl-5-hydroxy-6-metoxy-1,4-benzoquinol methylase